MNESFLTENLNPDQVRAVTQMNNAVVAAGAGSGKTFVLARRFAYLVVEKGFPVESILTLTFTQKAAAEMYDRIYKTLQDVSKNPKANSEEKRRAQVALDTFFSARIQTLDSYCASIVRQDSKSYGLRPDFSLDDDKVKSFIRKKAFSFVLEHRDNKSLQILAKDSDFESLAVDFFESFALLNTSLANPFTREKQLALQLPLILETWDKNSKKILILMHTLNGIVDETLEIKGKKASDSLKKMKNLLSEKLLKLDFPTKEELSFYCNSVTKNETQGDEYLKATLESLEILYDIIFPQQKIIIKEITEVREEIRTLYGELYSLALFFYNFSTTYELLALLEEFAALCVQQKRLLGVVTFSDIATLAVDILKNNINIRNIEKKRFNAIMIDEFQDNNDLQREMLYLLAEKYERTELSVPKAEELLPNKLFFVGDEKQSIYLFRGADVSVFRRLKQELVSDNISLKTNYRSIPGLIASFNSFFGGFEYPQEKEFLVNGMENSQRKNAVFLENTPLHPIADFEAEYEYVLPNFIDKNTQEPLEFDIEPKIHFAFSLTEKEEKKTDSDDNDGENTDEDLLEAEQGENLSNIENQAVCIAKKIKEKIANSNGTIKPQDFAILFRTTTHQYIFEKYLRAENIPYTSENVVNFFGDGPINDMYSLLRLLVFPQDIASYGVVLHSPFVGLSQHAVDICIGHLSAQENCLLFQDDVLPLLESENQQKLYKNAQVMFATLQEKQKKLAIHELISYFWYDLGYRYETLWNFDVSLYCDLYDFLYELAKRFDSEGQPLISFVEYLAVLKDQKKIDELDIPLERNPGVHIMTIHKSKGLEFPFVFVPLLDSPPKSDRLEKYVLCDETYGTSFNFSGLEYLKTKYCSNNFFFKRTKEIRAKKSIAELRRLLYVAITRAEQEVFLLGSLSSKSDTDSENKSEEEYVAALLQENAENKTGSQSTFLSLLYPVFLQYEFDFQRKNSFTVELMPCYSRAGYWQGKKASRKKIDVINSYAQNTSFLQPLEVFAPQNNHFTPSSFHIQPSDEPLYSSSYEKIDDLIAKTNKFTHADFGTLAHITIESELQKIPLKIPAVFLSNLTNKQLDEVLFSAKKMADNFLHSDLGQERKNALQHFSEFTFKSCLIYNKENFLIDGQIDLIIEKERDILLIDFKTDLQENPQMYYNQLALYCKACKDIFQKEIHCYLFYLRSGHSYEITEAVQKISLEKLIQDTLLQKNIHD